MGIFLRSVLRENGVNPDHIQKTLLCSVVPDTIYSIRNCCLKYFKSQPFILQAGVKTGLRIKYRNPLEVGSDRIANSIAAVDLFPGEDLIIVDYGTATTFDAVTKDKDYLGGVILAGIRISMEALESKTAKLPAVEILRPEVCTARSTIESIQAGLFYGHLGAAKEIIRKITEESFQGRRPRVIGTGGFASLFRDQGVFDHEYPELVLRGLLIASELNSN
jgi:type III pantothenate kinase